jgi:hypothetical protein
MPVSDEDADSGSQQQSVHQLVTAAGPHEPGRLAETEVHLPYSPSYYATVITDLMARPQVTSAPI